jgi:hypothetical protein
LDISSFRILRVAGLPLLHQTMPRQNLKQQGIVNPSVFHELMYSSEVFEPSRLKHDRYQMFSSHYARLSPLEADFVRLLDRFLQQWVEDRQKLNGPTFDLDCLTLRRVAQLGEVTYNGARMSSPTSEPFM